MDFNEFLKLYNDGVKDYSGQNLAELKIRKLDLTGLDFSGSNMTNVNLTNSNCTGANFTKTLFQPTYLVNTIFTDAIFSDTKTWDGKLEQKPPTQHNEPRYFISFLYHHLIVGCKPIPYEALHTFTEQDVADLEFMEWAKEDSVDRYKTILPKLIQLADEHRNG